jgi:hypothetical protein
MTEPELPVPPTLRPDQRPTEQITPAESYRTGDQVWVFRHDEWLFGIVEGASPWAVMVTYQRQGMRGTVVDTVPAECLARRGQPLAAGGER